MNTLVIGATTRASRYSNMAIRSLLKHNQKVIALGIEEGEVEGVLIETVWNPKWEVDTVTLYLNPKRQEDYYDRIIALKPRRVIFNPGTENEVFESKLLQHGIACEVACTLVLLSIGKY